MPHIFAIGFSFDLKAVLFQILISISNLNLWYRFTSPFLCSFVPLAMLCACLRISVWFVHYDNPVILDSSLRSIMMSDTSLQGQNQSPCCNLSCDRPFPDVDLRSKDNENHEGCHDACARKYDTLTCYTMSCGCMNTVDSYRVGWHSSIYIIFIHFVSSVFI